MFIAGIVTYNPDIKRLSKNLKEITNQFSDVFIVDNNSENIKDIVVLVKKYKNITLIKNENNLGIAKALNQIFLYADDKKVEWVLTLDQDSIIPENLIEEYSRYVNLDRVAIICPAVYDNNSKTIDRVELNDIEEVGICITSGSFTRVSIWKEIGGFEEKLFIDYVDNDYCIKLYYHDYKIVRVNNVVLNHELGHIKNHIYKSTTNHNYMRRYYIARNSIYVSKKYCTLFKNKYGKEEYNKINIFLDKLISPRRAYLRQFQFIVLVLLYENNKIKKIKAITKGIKDGNSIARKYYE